MSRYAWEISNPWSGIWSNERPVRQRVQGTAGPDRAASAASEHAKERARPSQVSVLLAERRERGLPAGKMKNVAAANPVKVMPRNQQATAVPPAEIPLQSQKGKCHDDN